MRVVVVSHFIGWAIVTGTLLACGGCFLVGSGPKASRVRADNHRGLPTGTVHVVENGRRLQAVFVDATPGYATSFDATWVTALVPLGSKDAEANHGPVWTGRADRTQAAAIARLPNYRNSFELMLYAEGACRRFGRTVAWILGTDPFVIGFEDAESIPPWPTPLRPVFEVYVVDRHLTRPISQVVLFPVDFWATRAVAVAGPAEVTVVTLPSPMPAGEILDAIATGEASKLGPATRTDLYSELRRP